MTRLDFLVRLHLWYAGRGCDQSAYALARLHPQVISLSSNDDCWRLETDAGIFFLSRPSQITRFVGIGVNMADRVFPKYTYEGFVEVEQGDTIVDVGAFIGEFSMQAAKRADRLVAVEPDERNAAALTRNLKRFDGIDVVNRPIWHESGDLRFNIAEDPSEGSILNVDDTGRTSTVPLKAVCLADLAAEFDLEEVDFLKVEAEGTEPEALEGIGDLNVEKIAVECSPERDGEPPTDNVLAWLSERNYSIRKRDEVVFARGDI